MLLSLDRDMRLDLGVGTLADPLVRTLDDPDPPPVPVPFPFTFLLGNGTPGFLELEAFGSGTGVLDTAVPDSSDAVHKGDVRTLIRGSFQDTGLATLTIVLRFRVFATASFTWLPSTCEDRHADLYETVFVGALEDHVEQLEMGKILPTILRLQNIPLHKIVLEDGSEAPFLNLRTEICPGWRIIVTLGTIKDTRCSERLSDD